MSPISRVSGSGLPVMCAECNALLALSGRSPLSQIFWDLPDHAAHDLSGVSTSATPAGPVKPLETVERTTPVTPSSCDYTIAPLSDSVPAQCGKQGVKRVDWDGYVDHAMVYCGLHWKVIETLDQLKGQTVEDLVEDPC